jgi:hypothetical protein
VLQDYQSGKRLPLPSGCTLDIYKLMLECWDLDLYRRKKPQAIMRDLNQILYQGIVTLSSGAALLILPFLLFVMRSVLPVVLFEFKNKVLRRIFGTKWEEARNKLCGLSPQTNYTD